MSDDDANEQGDDLDRLHDGVPPGNADQIVARTGDVVLLGSARGTTGIQQR